MAGMTKPQMAALGAFQESVARLNNIAQGLEQMLGLLTVLGYIDEGVKFLKSAEETAAELVDVATGYRAITPENIEAFLQVAAGALLALNTEENRALMQRIGGISALGTGGVLLASPRPLVVLIDLVGKTARMASAVAASAGMCTALGIPALTDADLRVNAKDEPVTMFDGFTMTDFQAMAGLITGALTALHSDQNRAIMVALAGTDALGSQV